MRKGPRVLKSSLETMLEGRKNKMFWPMRTTLTGLYGAWPCLDDRINTVSKEIEEISRTKENCVKVTSDLAANEITARA
ncbi:MAG: hypothetical protein AAGF13_00430 [Pseudomonadota bacterium]